MTPILLSPTPTKNNQNICNYQCLNQSICLSIYFTISHKRKSPTILCYSRDTLVYFLISCDITIIFIFI